MTHMPVSTGGAFVLPDGDALLAALVLVPAAYSRNRFFHMYRDTQLRRVRRRASELRGLVRDLARRDEQAAEVEVFERDERGAALVRYRVATLNLKVTARLSPTEAAIVDVALARARGERAPSVAQVAVDALLVRLMGEARATG